MSRRAGWMLGIVLLVTAVLAGTAVALVDDGPLSGDRPEAAGASGAARTSSPSRSGAAEPDPVTTPASSGRTTLATPAGPAATLPAPSLRAAQDEPAPGPIVVVPGYGGQTALLQPLVRALRAEGRQTQVLTGLGDATQDLRRQARTLDRRVEDLLAAGAPSVDVLGFSAGGVVARIWAEDGGSAHVRRVVTLGSPHHGTDVAGLAALFLPDDCLKGCRQLQPGSPLLSSLVDGAPGPNWTSIWTLQDQISTPARTALLAGAVNVAVQEVCPGVRVQHGALPRTGFVVDLVVDALAGPEPWVSAPTSVPSGCPAPS